MHRVLIASSFLALFIISAGCEKEATHLTSSRGPSQMALLALPDPSQHFIAERHKIEILTSASQLEKSWESLVAFCGTLHCEVMSSTITTRAGDTPPSGTVSLRVAPQDLPKLLGHLQTLGKIAKHTTQREDVTTQVVDTDARIRNLTAFRDNLRAMLAKPSASVKDLVEIQKQLTDTQSDMDSETAQRKILANETEKIALDITFYVESAGGTGGGFAEIKDALRDSGSVLADSTAALITVIVSIVPWLILIVPAIWLLTKAWRKLRRKRSASLPPSTSVS
jgi:Domain of unknown function (DUF4349)